MAEIKRQLSNSFEGALAGGGDPATSPLYVFGPFLRLIVVAGVAEVTFGASVWLVVLTVAVVSSMYRLVMGWITDGSGGSGLSEEEFGGWAVKVNAGITFVEYTLTFLVSIAALVTFLADRLPFLNQSFLGLPFRTLVAIGLSLATGWVVNRGPRVAAPAFGPATGGVLLLLWLLVFATIFKLGLHLPRFELGAFAPPYLDFTFKGYGRILALMTGIEVFANLVPAYEGTPAEKSRKAFGSLLIIMGTTSVTMLVLGPAILRLSDPTNPQVSVFTQTMDQLLPGPLAIAGTLLGVAVLLSASAASAQGLQNLALGLRHRHYIPRFMGQRNRHGVASQPVWLEVGIVSFCFLLFGTREETYLAIYAAGVFVLLSMTGWAAARRVSRALRPVRLGALARFCGVVAASLLTTGATLIIFVERFAEGAWAYFLLLPLLFLLFSYFRARLGRPVDLEARIKELDRENGSLPATSLAAPAAAIHNLLVPLDGSPMAERALPLATRLCRAFDSPLTLAGVNGQGRRPWLPQTAPSPGHYLQSVAARPELAGLKVRQTVGLGRPLAQWSRLAHEHQADLVVVSPESQGQARELVWRESTADTALPTVQPLLLVPAAAADGPPSSGRILVALDGSAFAERALPYAVALARKLPASLLLLSVPEAPDVQHAKGHLETYLQRLATRLRQQALPVETRVTGRAASQAILEVGQQAEVALIVMAIHRRGRLARLLVGSASGGVVRHTTRPVLLVPG